ncbi:hypothetical protein ACFOQM_12575 [Paenibacillus sp. GCM10012307]|uniref:Uncharacterized protein n=1 Tax=Paenibacillus roseus TaxID=2798579 RepID=A0A934MVH5_9BACL|nr:hypothetical protein [Paenibacillus roseus]MBJ6362127.1 hypothetical protein [Paenibacillus roseus]
MVKEALLKLQSEIESKPKNKPVMGLGMEQYVRYIGAELMRFARENPDKAELFMAEGKSIIGSIYAMRKVAEKKKTGNMAMLTPNEGMAVVLEYYGIQQPKAAPEPELELTGFNVDIDDLL